MASGARQVRGRLDRSPSERAWTPRARLAKCTPMPNRDLFSNWTFASFAPGSIPRSKYNAFREIHAGAVACFALLARIEDVVMARRVVDWHRVDALTSELAARIRQLADQLQVMNPVRFMDVHDWVAKVGFYARLATAMDAIPATPPYCVPIQPHRSADKQAWPVLNLVGAADKRLAGLLLTPSLFQYFIEANDLRPALDALLQSLDAGVPDEIERVSQDLRALIRAGVLPDALSAGLEIAAEDAFSGQAGITLWAFAGRDGDASCAGRLEAVRPRNLVAAWVEAVTFKYAPEALLRRLGAGLADDEYPLTVAAFPDGAAAIAMSEKRLPSAEALLPRLESILPHVARLHVFQAQGASLRAEHCRSLHDLVCLCLERGLAQIFSFAGRPALGLSSIKQLRLEIPVACNVFNLGGGLFPSAVEKSAVGMEDVRSAPAWSLLMGLTSPLVCWPGTTHEDSDDVAPHSSSYAVMSQLYMYCTLRLAQNLYVIECDCDDEGSSGHIGYRFKGGNGTWEQRSRRLEIMRDVLEGEGFEVRSRGDYLEAVRGDVEDVFLQRSLVSLGLLVAWVQSVGVETLGKLSPGQGAGRFKALLTDFLSSPL